MRHIVIFIGLIILISACGQKSELIKNRWLIVDGSYLGQLIEFHSTDFITFSQHEKEILSLDFSKDGTINLPGINSPNISAKWIVEDDKVKFLVDSMKYFPQTPIDSALYSLEAGDSYAVKSYNESKNKEDRIKKTQLERNSKQ